MINAIHAIVYARDADRTRAFFRDTLGLSFVDAGQGWLIFGLPPAELGVHPAEEEDDGTHRLYLMCDDVEQTVAELTSKGVRFTQPIADVGWGRLTVLALPGGGELGLYEPRHPTTFAARLRKGGAKGPRRKSKASRPKAAAKARKKAKAGKATKRTSRKAAGKSRRKRGRSPSRARR